MKSKHRLAAALALASVLLCVPIGANAQAPSSPAQRPGSNIAPPDPALDAKLRDYFQKVFELANPAQIQFGPSVITPMPGITARHVAITTDKGQGQGELFVDNDHRVAILGNMYDLSKDPWAPHDLRSLHLNDRPVLGPADAPVTVIEFADYECPHCAHAFSILENMVHNTYKGKLRVIYKYYPLNGHPWAKNAAYGAECARLQNPDDFWEMSRYLFANQGSIDIKNVESKIDDQAKQLKLDVPTLNACMHANATQAHVAEDEKDGEQVGVSSTPTFFVNGVQMVGLPDEKWFDHVIKAQIDQATGTAGK